MQRFDRLKSRFRTLFHREQVEQELHREMEFHLQEQIAENIARGMSRETARSAALRTIGGLAQIEEQCREQRGLHLIEATAQDVRYALRSLRSSPAFTIVAVLSLALGVGANTAIFSLIDSILLNSLPVKDPQQLVYVRTNRVKVGNFMVSRTLMNRDLEQMQQHATLLDGVATDMREERLSVAVAGHAELSPGDFVSGTYFQVLQVHAQLGRTINPADDSRTGNAGGTGWTAMISDGYWQRRFGRDPGVVGQRITVNTVPFVVVGVMPRSFEGLTVDQGADLAMPAITSKQVYSGSPSAGFPAPDEPAGSSMIARLRKGTPASKAAAELTVIFRAAELSQPGISAATREQIQKRSIEFEPAGRGSSSLRRRFSDPLLALMAVVALVMLIACANIASLLLAKASARQKEIAIRLSLGSSRKRIMRQLLTESLILSLLGCTTGILFAIVARNITLKLGAGSSAQASALALNWDFRLLFFIAAVCIVNASLFGVVPALRATSVDPNEVLKGTQSTQHSARLPFGRVLVTAQLAVSLALVVGAGLFLGSLRNLYQVDLGFDHENLLMATLDPHLIGFSDARTVAVYKQLLQDIKALPSVSSASLMNNRLFTGRAHLSGARVPGYVPQPGEDLSNSFTLTYGVGPRIFQTLRMPLAEGRDFSETDNENAPPVVIINEAMAQHYFRDKGPIGKKITFGRDTKPAEIVGVARNAHYFDVQDEKQDAIFTPLLQIELKDFSSEESLVVRTTAKPEQAANDVRAVVRRIDPNLPLFDVTTMSTQVSNDLSTPRLMATLSSFFGLLALTLSAIGLYGILAYGVTKRTGEIGIRMALGADRSSILKLILGETGQLVMIGVASGLGLAWAASRLLKSMLYGLSVHDARVFALGALVLAAVALAAAMLPARRAVRVEPMVALRYE
jgi:predicted permease